MGIFDKIKGLRNIQQEEPKEEKKAPNNYYSERQVFRQFEDLRELELAIQTAENVHNPNYLELHRILDRVEEDAHYASQWDARKHKVLERDFKIVNANDEVIEDLQSVFEKDWFNTLMHYILDVKKRGFVGITLGKWNGRDFVGYKDSKGNYVNPIDTIPYRHITPKYAELLKIDTDYRGVSVFDKDFKGNLIYLKTNSKYGLSGQVAKYVLIKDNALLNWSEWAEVFGMDIRIGKTDADSTSRKRFRDALKKLGSGAFGVFDKDDEIEYISANRPDAYKVYQELLQFIDGSVSNLVFGQDVVMKQSGRVLGTAAENMTNVLMEADSRYLKGVINSVVFEKLRLKGIEIPEDAKFEWETSENLSLSERADIDLKISQMGRIPSIEYLERVYDVEISEENIADSTEVINQLRNMYK